MAQKLQATSTAALAHPKFVRKRASDGAFWNTSGTPAFEAYNASHIAAYGITAAEGAPGDYTATDPADTTPGIALFVAAAGASLATSDLPDNVYYIDERQSSQLDDVAAAVAAVDASADVQKVLRVVQTNSRRT